MKKIVFLLFCLCLLVACCVNNRIVISDGPNKGLKITKLTQSPDAFLSKGKVEISGRSDAKLTSTYLFEEKVNDQPEVTVNFRISHHSLIYAPDTQLSYDLDGEIIEVIAEKGSDGRFIIPENLWLPLMHSQKLQGSIYVRDEIIQFQLNQLEKNKLAEFFRLTIEQRKAKYPPNPEGMKKW